jgi:hypothetical protein
MTATSPLVSVQLASLKDWACRLLVKQGMYAADADVVALRLIESELMGRSTGGLRWLPRLLSAMDLGDIDPRAQIVMLTDLPALAVIDGSTGAGQVGLTHAVQLAAKKARAAGSAVVVLRNSRPVGDPTACLAAATSAGCVAGIMTTCKKQTDPWQIGPCTVWSWPGAHTPLITSVEPPAMGGDLFADAIASGLAGTKPSAAKKRLFGDDAEYVCFATDISQCREPSQFHAAASQAAGSQALIAPAWIFERERWPATATVSNETVAELRELGMSARVPAEW